MGKHKQETPEFIKKEKINIDDFIKEIATRVKKNAIITISSPGGTQAWDIKKCDTGALHFGTEESHDLLFRTRLCELLSEDKDREIILHSFTDRMKEESIPTIELRGYTVRLDSNRKLVWRKASKAELLSTYSTDATTSKPLPFEPAVEYCDDSD